MYVPTSPSNVREFNEKKKMTNFLQQYSIVCTVTKYSSSTVQNVAAVREINKYSTVVSSWESVRSCTLRIVVFEIFTIFHVKSIRRSDVSAVAVWLGDLKDAN